MQVRTPSTSRHKITHTPPSGSSSAPTTSTKFLKDVTGKGLKKIGSKFYKSPSPNLNSTTPEADYVEEFPPEPKYVPGMKGQLGLFRRRPAPLDFGVLTPPSTIKRNSRESPKSGTLASPLELSFKVKKDTNPQLKWTWEKSNRDGSIQDEMLAFHTECFDDSFSSIHDSLYEAQPSPTDVMQFQRNIRKASETKRRLSKTCILCHESLQVLLNGEKIIQLKCEHYCHMDCFLAAANADMKSIQCSVCNKDTSPFDEEILNELQLKKIREVAEEPRTIDCSSKTVLDSEPEIVVHSLSANTCSSNSNLGESARKLETPKEQLINTAQLSAHGFRELFPPLYETTSPITFDKLEELKPSTHLVEAEFNITLSPQLQKYRVNENSDKIIFPHAINVFVPDSNLESRKKLKLVLCLSLINCAPNEMADEEYLKIVKNALSDIISGLDETDELGLILVGRDGCGNIGCAGTFYGFVSKLWDGWQEIIDEMTVFGNNDSIFLSSCWELNAILETADRLLSTLTELEEEFIRHMVILTGHCNNRSKIEMLSDSSITKRMGKFLGKFLNNYEFTISHWLPETQVGAFFLKDCSPRWNHSISTKFFSGNNPPLNDHIQWLHNAVVDRLVVNLKTFDQKIAKIHSIEFDGTLARLEKSSDEEQIIMGPFSRKDHKIILLEVRIDSKELKSYLEATQPTSRQSLEEYLSNGSNYISILDYIASYSQGKKSLSDRSDGISIDFTLTCPSPTLNYGASLFHVGRSITDSNNFTKEPTLEENDESTLFLDLPLVPPLTPSRDCVFVTRQMELVIIDSLRNVIATALTAQDSNLTSYSMKTITMELTTVLFGMSRGCICLNPRYYDTVGQKYKLENYVEKLTQELHKLADHANPLQKMDLLIHKLK